MRKVCNVGINDLPSGSCSHVSGGKCIIHPFYNRWKDMLRRCYSKESLHKRPTYIGCTVCDEWLRLSAFKSWLDAQGRPDNWQIDKDILNPENKVYCPEYCILVPSWLNNFVLDGGSSGLLGSHYDNTLQRYRARVHINGKQKSLGLFLTEQDAHAAWKSAKLSLVNDMKTDLDLIDPRVYNALIERYRT